MNSVVAEAEEWPQHLKLAPSNENTVKTQTFVQCTKALFLAQNRHFTPNLNFNADFGVKNFL